MDTITKLKKILLDAASNGKALLEKCEEPPNKTLGAMFSIGKKSYRFTLVINDDPVSGDLNV